nr:hypothetical protein [Escherichia coli]
MGLRGGLNLYAYAPNPLSWIDPFGLSGVGIPYGFKSYAGKDHQKFTFCTK